MIDKVKIVLDNKEYELSYNNQTNCYEANIIAPEETGLHVVEIECKSGDELAIGSADLIVLKKEDVSYRSKESIAYFLDKKSLEILEVIQLNINEINRDLETNGNSIFTSVKKLSVEENDFIYLKKGDKMDFFGTVISQEESNDNKTYTITCKDILNLFDIDIFVENENIISEVGIEDFIAESIKSEFVNNNDEFVNRNYLSVDVLTHNPKNIKVSSIVTISNDTYNLLTFINNAIEKYDVQIDFLLLKDKIKIEISTKNDEVILIDTTVSDITNYSETFSLSYISKVEVKNKENNNIYYRYLLSDRTTTTNKEHPNRIFGKVKKIVVEHESDSEQSALDIFKGNSYNHNITFDILKDSKLHDIEKIKIGAPVLIKTKNNSIYNTYISKIRDNETKFLTITCGNLRVDYIDKFLQERRK